MSAPRLVLTDGRFTELKKNLARHSLQMQPLGEHDCYLFSRSKLQPLEEAEVLAVVLDRPIVPASARITNWETPTPLVGGGVRYHVVVRV